MHFIDILLLVPLLWGAWKGFSKGLIIEVATLGALLLGVWGGINFSDYMAEVLTNNFEFDEQYLPILAFALTFLLILALVFAVGKLAERFVNVLALGMINKLAGGAFGILKVAVITSVLLVIVQSYDEKMHFLPPDIEEESLLYQPMTDMALTIIPALESSKMYRDVQGSISPDSVLPALPMDTIPALNP